MVEKGAKDMEEVLLDERSLAKVIDEILSKSNDPLQPVRLLSCSSLESAKKFNTYLNHPVVATDALVRVHRDGGITTVARSGNSTEQWYLLQGGKQEIITRENRYKHLYPKAPDKKYLDDFVEMGVWDNLFGSISHDKIFDRAKSKKVFLSKNEKSILRKIDDKDELKRLYNLAKDEPQKVQNKAQQMLKANMEDHFKNIHKLSPDEVTFFTRTFIKAGIYIFEHPISNGAMKALKEGYEKLSKRDVMGAVKSLDNFSNEMKGLKSNELEALEKELAEHHQTTIPEAYRNPHVRITHFDDKFSSTGKVDKKHPIFYGTDDGEMQKYLDEMKINRGGMNKKQLLDAIFKNGLPARGPNIHLDQHVNKTGERSAMRGSTQAIGNGQGTGSAAYWADEGGFVLVIDGVHVWDVNISLKGRIKKPDGTYGDNITKPEQELSFLAQVPPERIQGAYPIFLSKSRNILMPGDFIPNPHYKEVK